MFFTLALLAYSIDLLYGELPIKHPVMYIGDLINTFERRFYRNSVAQGALLVAVVLFSTHLVVYLLLAVSQLLPLPLSLLFLAVCASTGIAMTMLHDSVAEILSSEQPRKTLSYLVSRDTEQMSDTEVYKAALETWAENLSDGVIAPLFYLCLFGLEGIALYKAINTLDSMVGYKTERYYYFGRVAARLDDVANFIPARLTALLIVLVADNKALAWHCLWRDGNKLDSPNAGLPIAAMAGALAVALGGDAMYHGQLKAKPVLGEANHPVNANTVKRALTFKRRLTMVIFVIFFIGVSCSA